MVVHVAGSLEYQLQNHQGKVSYLLGRFASVFYFEKNERRFRKFLLFFFRRFCVYNLKSKLAIDIEFTSESSSDDADET